MIFLHRTKTVAHLDLNGLNGLMDGDRPKITDFGLTRSLPTAGRGWRSDTPGTGAWMAPEVFSQAFTVTTKADAYSFGRILWELIAPPDVSLDAAWETATFGTDPGIRNATRDSTLGEERSQACDRGIRFDSISRLYRTVLKYRPGRAAFIPSAAGKFLPRSALSCGEATTAGSFARDPAST